MNIKYIKHQKREITSTQSGCTGYLVNLSIEMLSLCINSTQLKNNKLEQ